MPRGKSTPPPTTLEELVGQFAAQSGRVGRQQTNRGRPTPKQEREQLREAIRAQLVAQIEADTRPLTERVPEYVMDYDDNSNYIGLKRARPPTPGPDRPGSTVRSER